MWEQGAAQTATKAGISPRRTAGADTHSPQAHPNEYSSSTRAAHPRAHGAGCWQLSCNIHQLMNNAPKGTSRSPGGAGNSSRDQAPSPFLGNTQAWAWQTRGHTPRNSSQATGHEPVQVCADSHPSSHQELTSPAQLSCSSELASSPALCARQQP